MRSKLILRVIPLAFLLMILNGPVAEAQYSVQFEKEGWEAAKEKARTEGKLIFIDGYTTWCEPCKMMDIQVFNRSKVARFFNRNFVNYKMDMEKEIGPIFAVNFGVQEFPSFLFLTPDGTLVHKLRGYKKADDLISMAKPALEPSMKNAAWDSRYKDGDRKADFLYAYLFYKMELMDGSHKPLVAQYLQTQKDWNEEKNVRFIFQFMEDIDSDMFNYMASNRGRFEEMIGKEEVSRTIDIMVNNKIFNSPEPPSMDEVDALYRLAYPEQGPHMAAAYKMEQYKKLGDFDNYANVLIDYHNRFPFKKSGRKEEIVKELFENANKEDQILVAYNWAKELQKKNRSIASYHMVAAFQHKLGARKEAKKTVKTALKMTKNQTYPEKAALVSLSRKIKAMKKVR